ncbi:MAG: hypothetical protein ABSH24_25025 [Bryobacteraceae bacterium]
MLVENPRHGGFAGDYLGGDPQDQIGPLDEHDQSVRNLLDLIVASSKGGLWITVGRYDRSRALSNQPFWRVLEYSQPLPTNLGRVRSIVREIQSAFASPLPYQVRTMLALSKVAAPASVSSTIIRTDQDGNPMQQILTIAAIFSCFSAPASGQYGRPPFQTCVPSRPEIYSLNDEQEPSEAGAIILKIRLRNISPKAQIVEARDPQYLFAARIVNGSGKPVGLTEKGEKLYSPPKPNDVLFESSVGPHPLQPQEEMTYVWRVSDIFDVSKPGSYRVALRAEIGDPAVIVCSKPTVITAAPVTEASAKGWRSRSCQTSKEFQANERQQCR